SSGAAANFIAGSSIDGIIVDSSVGNLITTNNIQVNNRHGITLNLSSNNTIGGPLGGSRLFNDIWTSNFNGVEISGNSSTNNVVAGNAIGARFNNFLTSVPNGQHGVDVSNGASNTTIGGAAENLVNYIGFNQQNGVSVPSTGNNNK